jgi:hypothetical protein
MKVYLDIDGVLLGQKGDRVVLAPHAAELINFVLDRFDVYWLTTHCRGDTHRVTTYLGRYASADFVASLAPIKPTTFDLLKTEALSGDFYWLDDSPLQAELDDLRRREMFDRWIDVNTRQRPDDLLFAMEELAAALQNRQGIDPHAFRIL